MYFSSCITNPNIIIKPLNEIIEKFIEYGFDGIDLPCNEQLFPLKSIKNILESYSNIKIPEITAMISTSLDLIHPDEKMRMKAINYIKRCIDYAAELNVNLTHMCFITFEENLTRNTREKLEKIAISAIKNCALYAEKMNVKLLIEPLYKGDVSLINRCEQAIELWCKALNIDESTFMNQNQFGLLQDIYHMHCEEIDLLSTIKKYNKITYHMHLADHLRGLDFTRPDSKFVKDAIKLLKHLNYSYYVSFETFDKSVSFDTLKNSLKILKS